MKLKKEQLQNYLDKRGISAALFACELGVDEKEVETLLLGEAVNEATARRFIYYFGADEAAEMIDWAAMGKEKPPTGKG